MKEFRTNRYDKASGDLVYTDAQVSAFNANVKHYGSFFGENSTKYGLKPCVVTDPTEVRQLTAFFSWTAWAAASERPGHDYTYTNNWPAEPRVDNGPTADLVLWSGLSLIALLGGTGVLFAVYGRGSQRIGWHSSEAPAIAFRQPGEVALTPAQRSTAWFFFVIAALFVVQTLVGAAAEHYRADLATFFGIDLAKLLPCNLARTWHLELSLFWTAAAFLAAGIFLAPFIAGREPRRQHWLSFGLLGALVVVVVGSLTSEALSIHGVSWAKNSAVFGQQWEYLDLPRLWQILLTVGMTLWIVIVFRGIRSRLKRESLGNMPWLFFYSALAIPAFYAVGLLAGTETHFSVADFWRFWVVHLWVEDFLELLTTVMVAYIFVMLGVVRERIALGIIFLDVILYSAGGVIGTMHHLYFSGTPVEHMALGAFFSAAEVIPLTFLTVEAWTFLQLGSRQERKTDAPFPHRWAVMFLVAVGFWNFLGAGVAYSFDLLARRSQAWRNGSFTYHPDHDAWACPQDQWLWPTTFDPEQRTMRYRAKPSVCNSCPVKADCPTSAHGREVVREVDPWPHSEAGRFHRGISCAVALIGLLLPVGMLFGNHTPADVLVLALTAVVVLVSGTPLAAHLWQAPSGFPMSVPHEVGVSTDVEAAVDRYATRWGIGPQKEKRP